jgi:hypothetical protein
MMNIDSNPYIDAMASRCSLALTKWTPDTLRNDPKIRKNVSDEAGKILKDMEGLI